MSNPNIVKGYKGIMDLDLSSIPPSFHKETIALHLKDIEEYKREQLNRPERLRYDNTMERVNKMFNTILLIQNRLSRERQEKQEQIYKNKL